MLLHASLSAPQSRYRRPQLVGTIDKAGPAYVEYNHARRVRSTGRAQRRRSPTRGQCDARRRVGGMASHPGRRRTDGRTDGRTDNWCCSPCCDVLIFVIFFSAGSASASSVAPPALPDEREWLAEAASLSGDSNLVRSILARQGPATTLGQRIGAAEGIHMRLGPRRMLWLPRRGRKRKEDTGTRRKTSPTIYVSAGAICVLRPVLHWRAYHLSTEQTSPMQHAEENKSLFEAALLWGRRGQDRLGGRKWRRGRSTGELPGNPVDAFGLGHETLQEDGRSGIGRETEDLVRDGAIVSWAHPQRGKNKKRSNAIGERGGGGRERRGCDALTNRKMQTTLHFLFAAGAGWTTRCGWMCMGGGVGVGG